MTLWRALDGGSGARAGFMTVGMPGGQRVDTVMFNAGFYCLNYLAEFFRKIGR